MRILTLTDHTTHGPGESIYKLLCEMSKDVRCTEIWVASRAQQGNARFFDVSDETQVIARQLDDEFSYSREGEWFDGGSSVDTKCFDVVFLRVDRPVSDELLESFSARFACQIVVNSPMGIQETGAKDFLLRFAAHCAPMRLCRTKQEVLEFCRKRAAVLKPLRGYGGKGLVRLDGDAAWIEGTRVAPSEAITYVENAISRDGSVLATQFLPTIHLGDKRIVVVNGETLGAMLRIPAENHWLANLSQGGSSTFAEIEPEEYEIAEAVSPVLLDKGVVIYGFDTLVGEDGRRVLSEVNTLNVGGFLQAEQHSGQPVVGRAAKLLIQYLDDRL
jgi:glutathione synthase